MLYDPQLETFLRVADAGSFNKAAEEMFITPPAIIKQITSLGSGLELQLFVRSPRGLKLTEAGKSIYRDARYIVQYCKDSVVRAKNAAEDGDHIIRIGISPMTPGQFLLDLWPGIQAHCPDIKFKMIPYENTPENSVEILRDLGKNIDIVAGLFDQKFLEVRQCAALELSREPIRCAVSIYHPLSSRETLTVEDLHGENFLLIRRGWNHYLDQLRDDLWRDHPQIHIVDFDMFNINVFDQCENSEDVLMTIDNWRSVHPLLKTIPVEWSYTIPFGLLHSPRPSPTVKRFLSAVRTVLSL
ncbi:LysR family transcriptional regulator [uncultured Intestinimonas sp.]|uniref:LysR family transcriptional regulator n=1 Tax=uncultured Intestinimonas sp. TaxID=1689265 RepID=UPI0026292EE2|nr:LysR family transcriptional regulator [uncultured Intestinimonas sp.]